MARFVSRALYWLRSFGAEFAGLVFPGAKWFQKLVPWLVIATAWVFGNSVAGEWVVRFGPEGADREARVTAANLFAGVLIALWVLVGVGWALARAFRARLVVADKMELDVVNHAFRVAVWCEGFGEIKPKGKVSDLRDATGAPILEESVRGLPLHWTHRPAGSEVVLTEESGKESFTVLYLERRASTLDGQFRGYYERFCIYSPAPPDHLQSIVQNLPREKSEQLWIKLRVAAAGCEAVERWYTVVADDKCPARYRPIPTPNPLPAFCG